MGSHDFLDVFLLGVEVLVMFGACGWVGVALFFEVGVALRSLPYESLLLQVIFDEFVAAGEVFDVGDEVFAFLVEFVEFLGQEGLVRSWLAQHLLCKIISIGPNDK